MSILRRTVLALSAGLFALALPAVLGGCATSARSADTPALYPGFDGYARTVTTDSAEAQLWFDQGIQLLYGFNHDEAIRSFREATVADPNCVMAWWGIAYASGMHINNPDMSEQQSRQAWEAAQEALHRIEYGTPVEQSLVQAVARRYAWPMPEDRSSLDQAYADAMERAWQAYPNDADVGTLFAESLMDLQPWDLWTVDGAPKGRAEEIVVTLEEVMRICPDHPGANHFYIHTVEASNDPARALASADRLTDLVPGAGHLVHMPSHIYARVGRYADASDANARAIAADRAYFALAPAPDFYSLYFVHNLHFLAYAAMMEGRYETAMLAARDLERDIPESFLREWTFVADGFMPVTYHVMIRFGRWEEILDEPTPPSYRLISRAVHHYARGVAYAATGHPTAARAEREKFEAVAARIPEDWVFGNNPASDVIPVARQMLTGEILFREGRYDEAFAALREGVDLEEELVYDEPPGWMQPVRHALGALLMAAGRPEEAEVVYEADLALNPGNGWSLLGLEQSLRAQQRGDEAAPYAERRARAWARADVRPTSSCFCEPGMIASGE